MLKLGVFGAYRGKCMIDVLEKYEGVELVAVCDKYVPLLEECKKMSLALGKPLACYTNFEDFFQHDMDAVILANYANEHAPFAIRLLKSGRHVASEVLTMKTMAEAVALIEAVEESGKIYSYLENYCYFPATTEMRSLYRAGRLGELKHAEGEYVHNCEDIWLDITYGERNHWRNRESSVTYCTHAFGPIMHITGLRPEYVVGMQSTPTERLLKLGNPRPEGGMLAIQMENGATVKTLQGNLLREPGSIWYSLYGTRGSVESSRRDGGVEEVSLYIQHEIDEMKTYSPEPVSHSALARETSSHGGADFYTVHYFIQSILNNPVGEENIINVYDAVDMCAVGVLGYRSICNGSVPVRIPNLRNKSEREQYRYDNKSVFGDGDDRETDNYSTVHIPDEVYDALKRQWEEEQRKKQQ